MCIVEIHEMDIISINKTMTKESKKTKTFVFMVALKRDIFIGSTKICKFQNFLELFMLGRMDCFFYKIDSTRLSRFQINYLE